MSKILFWSPLHGQGQTSNLHAVACIMSLLYKKRVLIMQTHFAKNNLELPLVGKNAGNHKAEDSELFMDIGLDAAITFSNMGNLSLDILESCCLTIPGTKLLLLPGTETKNRETFDRDIGRAVGRMIRDAGNCVDMVLIDSNSGDDELSLQLMNVVDLVVINLTQRKYVLDKFFSDYGEMFFDNDKAFYLFGDYDDNSCYNINNCRKRYKRYINQSNSGVVPYNTKYLDAQNECGLVSFMQEGLKINQGSNLIRLYSNMKTRFRPGKYAPEETYQFFLRSRASVRKMLDLLQIPTRPERRRGVGDAAV